MDEVQGLKKHSVGGPEFTEHSDEWFTNNMPLECGPVAPRGHHSVVEEAHPALGPFAKAAEVEG